MHHIKLSDATHCRPWLWSWHSPYVRIDLEHRSPILTIATINDKVIWRHPAQISPQEAWPDLALALLGHDIVCELTPQDYPSVTLPEMDGP